MGQKEKEKKLKAATALGVGEPRPPAPQVIELTWLMMLKTLVQSSLHCTSRIPCHGSHSTRSLLDAHQTAFDWTQKFILRAMEQAN
jgi:hypothetical protein